MNSWRPYPMVRLAFPLLAGILTGDGMYFQAPKPGFVLALFLTGFTISMLFPLFIRQYRLRIHHGVAANLTLLLGGYLVLTTCRIRERSTIPPNATAGIYLVSIAGTPSGFGNTCSVIVDVQRTKVGGHWIPVNGKALVRLTGGGAPAKLMLGDYLLLKISFRPLVDKSNPSTFSYIKYLIGKGVSHEGFSPAYAWKLLQGEKCHMVRRKATFIRDHLLAILVENGMTGREFAVAAALLLGYTGDIDAGLRKGYAASGAMHILSVSGMHVGVIYLFLEVALKFLHRKKAGKITKAIIILWFLWFYALLTGLSPPVIRSAAMLSLPIIARALNRPPDIVNVLATSLFFIMAVKPSLVFDAGFQLSYLAVGGIVFLYKPIYDLYITSKWLPDKIWSVIAVSIAAQLSTLPVTLYYFHQFPNYFLLTNLLVVPLSGIIIYTGIVVLIVSSVPFLAPMTAKALSLLIWLLNEIIMAIERIPGSVSEGIFISFFMVIILYMLILGAYRFFSARSFAALTLVLILLIVMGVETACSRLFRLYTHRILVYSTKGQALYRFSSQNRAVFLYDRKANREILSTAWGRGLIQPDLDASGIQQCRYLWIERSKMGWNPASGFIPLLWSGNIIQFNDYRIIIANRRYPATPFNAPKADAVIVTGNPFLSVHRLHQLHHPSVIVIDPTNSRSNIARWKNEAQKEKITIHVVQDNGPWMKDFFQILGNCKK